MRPRLAGLFIVLALLVGAGPVLAARNFTLECGTDRSAVVGTGVTHVFRAPLRAVSPGNDSVLVTIETHMPASWFSQFCQVSTGICYVDEARIRLVVGVSDTLTIDVFPSSTPGIAGVELTVRSLVDPGDVERCSYALYAGVQPATAGFSANCTDNTRWLTSGDNVTFNMPIQNTGPASDSLWVTLHPNLPGDWFAQFCQVSTGICYVDEAVLRLPYGASDVIQVDFFMFGTPPESGAVEMDMHSRNNPVISKYCYYQVFLGNYPGDVGDGPSAARSVSADPNPFRDVTRIVLRAPQTARAGLCIYGADGRVVRSVPSIPVQGGRAEFQWDGRNDGGQRTASGIYFYRFTTDRGIERGTVVRTR